MLVALDGEALVGALVEVAAAGAAAVLVPAADVGDGEPLHEAPELAVGGGQQDQVPVVAHEAVGEQADAGEGGEGFGEHFQEGGVVAGGVEDGRAGVAAVEHVEHDAAGGDAGGAGHGGRVTRRGSGGKKMYLSPLFIPVFGAVDGVRVSRHRGRVLPTRSALERRAHDVVGGVVHPTFELRFEELLSLGTQRDRHPFLRAPSYHAPARDAGVAVRETEADAAG